SEDGKQRAKVSRSADLHVVTSDFTGMFYAFANDWWGTYDNNSGLIEIAIERVDDVPDDAVGYRITPRGEVVPLGVPTLRVMQAVGGSEGQEMPHDDGGPARGRWFGGPVREEMAAGPAFAPQTWREAATAEQAGGPGFAFADAVVAKWSAPPEAFLARRPRSL